MKNRTLTYRTRNKEERIVKLLKSFMFIPLSLLLLASCQKIEYTTMDSPAYLRVFNSINFIQVMENKGRDYPYLCMLINPEFDAQGVPISAEIVGDFLDMRDLYAPPYPSHIGVSTTLDNPEYPGKETVLVGPVLNGFDLSSWAQVPSGQQRVMFVYRPKNETPFFSLSTEHKTNVVADTVVRLDAGEVYTMHVLERDFNTWEKGILLRQENFHKLPLSDSLVYFNFYNYSAKGYWGADKSEKLARDVNVFQDYFFDTGIRDTMNIFLSLYNQESTNHARDLGVNSPPREHVVNPDYSNRFLHTLRRDVGFAGRVAPYHSFPLWADSADNGIYSSLWQRFYFMAPGMTPESNPYFTAGTILYSQNYGRVDRYTESNVGVLDCGRPQLSANVNAHLWYRAVPAPNLIVNTHSGTANPRSFAAVSSVEVINGKVYVMTIQRQYAPPIY